MIPIRLRIAAGPDLHLFQHRIGGPGEKKLGVLEIGIGQQGALLLQRLSELRPREAGGVIDRIGCKASDGGPEFRPRRVGAWQPGCGELPGRCRKRILLVALVADLAGEQVVVVTVRQPPIVRLRSEVLDVTMGHGLGGRFAIGTFAVRLRLQHFFGRFPLLLIEVEFGAPCHFGELDEAIDSRFAEESSRRLRVGIERSKELNHAVAATSIP